MLLIKNANLDGTGKIVDILIGDDGKYKEIAGHIEAPAGVETIDATGMMACPTFVNTHMHFDKAYTSYEQGRESYGKGNWISSTEETLDDSIYVMHDRIRKYTPEAVAARAERAIKDCVMYGTTKLRTNVDISTLDPNLNALKGVLMAKEATKDICDLQVIAFPQEGIICDPGTDKLLEEAMEMMLWVACLPLKCWMSIPANMWISSLRWPKNTTASSICTSISPKICSIVPWNIPPGLPCSMAGKAV